MSRAGLLWLEGLALVSGAATLPSKKSQCSEEPTKPHREVFKQMGPKAAGHHETQSHFSLVSEGSELFSSGELFSPSPQMLGVCSPEVFWHICPGFKSPLSTLCQCSHTAACPPCCTYVLLEKPSPQPLISVCQVSLSREQACSLTADSQTCRQAQHKACSSLFPSCRVMPSSTHCLGKG